MGSCSLGILPKNKVYGRRTPSSPFGRNALVPTVGILAAVP